MKHLLIVLLTIVGVTFLRAEETTTTKTLTTVSKDGKVIQETVTPQTEPQGLTAGEQFRLDSMQKEHDYELRETELRQHRGTDPQDIIGVMIPIIAIFGSFFVVWRGIESKRVLRMAMIEKGMDPSLLIDRNDESSKKYGALRFGMLLAGVGLGLLVAFVIVSSSMINENHQPLVFISSSLLFGGIGLIGYHLIANRLEKK
ncbi:MAG TPA: DUF6249 domain-containing protein [Candidatus Didemnitutus sp.]|nr:DUF6249 domain-containing protein [Candidatus Didemnitutus sp.]